MQEDKAKQQHGGTPEDKQPTSQDSRQVRARTDLSARQLKWMQAKEINKQCGQPTDCGPITVWQDGSFMITDPRMVAKVQRKALEELLKTVDAVSSDMHWECNGYCGKKQPMVVSSGGPALRARAHIGGQ